MNIPKITKLGLQNFKAFGGNNEEFEIKPLTLIYGYNSSGKSSFLHSFLYLDEWMRSGNLDVHRPTVARGEVDLGGFDQFVNRTVRGEYGPARFSFEIKDGTDSYRYSLSIGKLGGTNLRIEKFEVLRNFGPWLSLETVNQEMNEICHRIKHCGDMDEEACSGWQVFGFGDFAGKDLRLEQNGENKDETDGFSILIRATIKD